MLIGVLFDSNFPITITHVVDPIGLAFHQKPTQKTKAHHKICTPGIHCVSSKANTGSIATVIGILSIIAERRAVPQSIAKAVRRMF